MLYMRDNSSDMFHLIDFFVGSHKTLESFKNTGERLLAGARR